MIVSSHTFTVQNKGKTAKTYKLTHVPAGTALTIRKVGYIRWADRAVVNIFFHSE